MVDTIRSEPNLKTEQKQWKRSKKHLIPVMNQLLLQMLPEEDDGKSKIIMPDTLKSQGVRASQRFLVIAAGPDCKQVKEGNVIVGLTGIPHGMPPGVIHKGEQLAVLVETQCLTVECDENSLPVVM